MLRKEINNKIFSILEKMEESLNYQIQTECELLGDIQTLSTFFYLLNKEDLK